MKRLRYENGSLDAVDAKLLDALSRDARITIADLARLVGLSGPSVSERIRRLEEAGVISGYAATLDPKALGYPLAVWLVLGCGQSVVRLAPPLNIEKGLIDEALEIFEEALTEAEGEVGD